MAKFEIRRFSSREPANAILDSAAARGKAVGQSTSDQTKFILAGPTNFLGFLHRDVTAVGPTYPDDYIWPNLELPDKTGGQTTAVIPDEYEAEGADFLLLSGTGALASGTTIGTPVTFENGVARGADLSAAEQAFYRVSATCASGLSPDDAGGIRCRFERM